MHGNLVFEDDSNAIILSDQLVDAFIIIIKLHTHTHTHEPVKFLSYFGAKAQTQITYLSHNNRIKKYYDTIMHCI